MASPPILSGFCVALAAMIGCFTATAVHHRPFSLLDVISVEEIADRFTAHFNLTYPLRIDHLLAICDASGIIVEPGKLTGVRGGNCTYEGQTYIYYDEDDAPAGQIHTVLHELFEIVEREVRAEAGLKTCDPQTVEREAERFASNVQAPPLIVRAWVNEHGLDVIGLRRALECSWATALIKMSQVISASRFSDRPEHQLPPMIGLLYERKFWSPPPSGRTPRLRLSYLVKTPGFSFGLRKPDVKDIWVRRDGEMVSLHKVVKKERVTFIDDVALLVDGHAAQVNLLIQPVHWRNIHRKAAKVLVQIVPAESDALHQLTTTLAV